MNKVYNNIFVSDYFSASSKEILKDANIKAVLTIDTMQKDSDLLEWQAMNDIASLFIFLPDIPNANISTFFDVSYVFIKQYVSRGENVLVHCRAGISRSVTLVMNFILRELCSRKDTGNLNSKQLVKHVLSRLRSYRPQANPNPGFITQLEQVTDEYMKE